MTGAQSLAIYAVAILAGSLAGGAIPLLGGARRSDALLAFSAGVMLGAAFLHMIPEALAGAGLLAIPATAAGFLALYLLERYVLVHVCGPRDAGGGQAPPRVPPQGPDRLPAPPETLASHHGQPGDHVHTLGLSAWVGLSLHTLVDGFALGAATEQRALGFFVFLAILAHKIPNSFSLSAILRAEGYGRGRALLMNASFGLMVPAGAALYLALRRFVHAPTFTALALGVSAGTFLHLALSDLLPDLRRRSASRAKLAAALAAGVAVMAFLRLIHAE